MTSDPPIPEFPDADELAGIRRSARATARRFRLPFRSRYWKGAAGNWAGAGAGASIDFQDHRPYLPGDDPRHIDWNAYARTGVYSMKLYREEVSPLVDVALDVSTSMLHPRLKRDAALAAFYFCVESAVASGAFLRAVLVRGDSIHELEAGSLASGAPSWPPTDPKTDGTRALGRIPWRPSSVRVLISDCLFAVPPEEVTKSLSASHGRAVVLAPACAEESNPDWTGNVELLDVEGVSRLLVLADEGLLRRYAEAYRRHFESWDEACRRSGAAFVKLPAERGLEDTLREEVSRGSGAFEPWV